MSDALRYEEFLAHLASDCSLRYIAEDESGPTLPAVLAEVGARRERAGFEQFALLFHADMADVPQQGNHAVTFDDGVQRVIFLVPIAREGRQVVYEAIFNRPVAA
jgi:hypothetical protein